MLFGWRNMKIFFHKMLSSRGWKCNIEWCCDVCCAQWRCDWVHGALVELISSQTGRNCRSLDIPRKTLLMNDASQSIQYIKHSSTIFAVCDGIWFRISHNATHVELFHFNKSWLRFFSLLTAGWGSFLMENGMRHAPSCVLFVNWWDEGDDLQRIRRLSFRASALRCTFYPLRNSTQKKREKFDDLCETHFRRFLCLSSDETLSTM